MIEGSLIEFLKSFVLFTIAAPFFAISGIWRGLNGYWNLIRPKPRAPIGGPDYHGSWAIIVGSSSGIGLEYARALARGGLNVIVTSRSKKCADSVAATLKDHVVESTAQTEITKLNANKGQQFEGLAIDMSHPEEAIAAVTEALEGKDVSVGIISSSIEEFRNMEKTDAETAAMSEANCTGFLLLTHVLFRKLSENKKGTNMKKRRLSFLMGCSSISKFIRIKKSEAYCATRSFQSALLSQFARRAKREDLHVSVCNHETSAVGTERLVDTLEKINDPKMLGLFRHIAWNTKEFSELALHQMFGGANYICLGRMWNIANVLDSFGFPIEFSNDTDETGNK
mmetsp:Transcript_57428/g.69103  ORF Transcript_57428/g.69103 Transcript_57428/m.69103 type:complete len:340 (+) Transcript_57428:77-1096(+)